MIFEIFDPKLDFDKNYSYLCRNSDQNISRKSPFPPPRKLVTIAKK
jgi:hypothetical protein